MGDEFPPSCPTREVVQMENRIERTFVARTIYHHKTTTSEHVTLIVRKEGDAYELWDDREAAHEYLAGTEDYIFEEWGKRNRELNTEGFSLDNLTGENKWQKFIT